MDSMNTAGVSSVNDILIASVGFLGQHVGISPLNLSFNTTVLSRPASFKSQASTTVNSPVHRAEYAKSLQDGDHGENAPSDDEDYPEALALSPIGSNESFQHVEQDGDADVISISGSDDDSEYSDSGDDSDGSEELQFPLEGNGGNFPHSGAQKSYTYESEDMDDALWDKLLRSLPDTQQPHNETTKKLPVSRVGKPLSLELEELPRKRKFIKVPDGNNDYEEPTRGKRRRAF